MLKMKGSHQRSFIEIYCSNHVFLKQRFSVAFREEPLLVWFLQVGSGKLLRIANLSLRNDSIAWKVSDKRFWRWNRGRMRGSNLEYQRETWWKKCCSLFFYPFNLQEAFNWSLNSNHLLQPIQSPIKELNLLYFQVDSRTILQSLISLSFSLRCLQFSITVHVQLQLTQNFHLHR